MSSSAAAVSLTPSVQETSLVSLEERALVRAFALFMDAASALERSYTTLHAEVTRLRRELEETNRDLALSLEQTHRVRQHLDRILEGLPCGVLVIEVSGQISIANPEALRLLKVPSHALLAVADQLPEWAGQLLQRTTPDDNEQEHAYPERDSEWIAIRHARLSPGEGGSSIYILRDSSAAKQLEQAQESLQRRQALAEMSGLLAHEIRNPLGSLELFAGLLADANLGGEQEEWVAHLRAGLRTLAATVNNVLQFHSQPSLELLPTDLGRLLRSLEEFLRPLTRQAKIEIELTQQLDGVSIPGDHQRLSQVALNLALNAIHVMPDGGKLTITGGREKQNDSTTAHVEFTDSGPGVAAEHLHRIFEPGFTTRSGSPGLGLAVCKAIVEQHGGSIAVSSALGGGATFRLEFSCSGDNQ